MARPNRALEAEVIIRACERCEYCLFPESVAETPFHLGHIIAEKHGGETNETNLAWACFSCNMHKGPNIAGIDPLTGQLTQLFNPRKDRWDEHFQWHGVHLRGKTSIGRTTIAVLAINLPDAIAVRKALLVEGFIF